MADNKYLDDDQDEEKAGEEQPSPITRKKLILFAALGVLLIVVSIGGTLLAVKLFGPEPRTTQPVATEADGITEDGSSQEGIEEQTGAEEKKPKKSAIYYPIKPPIIVNFDSRGRQRFLQAELALMTRENDVVDAVELHMSMIRNSLILLIGSHLYEELQTAEGKEILRQQCLQEIQRLMEQEIGKPGVEQVLFTNFVMQ